MGISNKKCFKILVLFFSFIMSLVFSTKVNAADIKATNISLIDKSSTAEVEEPVMVNNEITSKIILNKENDYAVFDLTIKNNEKNKYKIESIIDNNENEYITVNYDYSKDYFEEETKVKIKFLYKNKLINHDKVSMNDLKITINLINDKGESTNIIINNPKTGDNISLYIIILILGVLGLVYTKKKIDFKGIKIGVSVLIFTILLLPFAIFAIDRYEIPITFKGVEAKGEFEVYDVMVEGIGIRQVTYGNEIGDLPEQPRDGYSFNGYEDENGVAVSSDTIVTGPKTIKPMYTIITYTITYDYNGGYATNPETYTVENTITLNNPTKKGYTFSGWTGSNGDALQTEVTINSLTGDLNYVANYSANTDTAYKVIHRYPNLDGTYTEEVENLTGATDSTVRPQTRDKTGFTSPELQDIVINAEGTSEIIYTYTRNNYNLTLTNPEDIESVFTSGSYPYETEITLKAKDKIGYTFSKWSDNETAKEYTFELVKDTELYPIYTPNTDTAYTVLHKTMNLDGTTYTVEETENLTGVTDTNVTPNVKTYTGFTSPSTQTVKVKGDGSTVVEYLYTRNKYTLNIEDKDKIEEDKSGEYYYGTEITVEAKDIPGYTFTGWENGGNEKTYTFNLTEDKTIKPLYTAGDATPYTVVHKTMNLDGTTYTVEETENLTGVTDTNVTPNVKTYTGFTSPSTQTVKVKGDGSTVVEYLYERNQYSLVYVDNDNIDLTNSTAPGDYYYGKEITIKAKEIQGYTFKQWSTGETDNPLTIILDGDLVINPEYTPNKYNVIFDPNTGTGTMDNEEMTYDVEKALSKNLYTKPGYVFKGWNTKEDKTGTHYNDEAIVKNLATSGNITIYAEWIEAQATFLSGQTVNAKMKQLAGNSSATFNSEDNNITSIQKSTTKPDISTMTSDNIVSTSNSIVPIYMWYDNGTIYWWSEDATPSLNNDSSFMFYNLKNVSNIELDSFDTSDVTSMMGMFSGCQSLTSLDVSSFNTSNVTSMEGMFYSCIFLSNLDLGDNFNTSSVTDMSYMFCMCPRLISLDLGDNFDTSNVTNMSYMFASTGIPSLNLGNKFDTSNVTNMSYMFANINVTNLDLGDNFDTSSVTTMSGMFNQSNIPNPTLTTIDLGAKFDTSNVTTMDGMFTCCSSLTNLDLGDKFDTSNVTNMRWMFYECSSLTSLDLGPNFDTNNVTDMENMFYKCRNLTSLDVSDFDTSNVTNMTTMFSDCNNLITIYASDKFVTTNVTSDNAMFRDSTKIVGGMGTTYSSFHTNKAYAHLDGGVSNPGYFTNKGTVNITFNANGGEGTMDVQTVPYNVATALNENTFTREGYIFDGWNTKSDGTGTDYADKASVTLTTYTPLYAQWKEKSATLDTGKNVNAKLKKLSGDLNPNYSTSNTIITSIQRTTTKPDISTMTSDNIISTSDSTVPVYAWYDNGIIYYYSDKETIKMNSDSSNLFNNLRNMESVDLSTLDTSNVSNMSSMFQNCKGLTSLDLGDNFDTSSVTNMSGMFIDCSSLTTLDLGDNFDTSNVTSMSSMFYGCSSLTSIDLSNFNTSRVTIMQGMFENCTSLTTLDLTNFDTSNVTNMIQMFRFCSSLTTLDLGDNFDTSNVTSMASMFSGCSSLTTLDLGDNFDTSNVTNMRGMFYECSSLTTLNLGTNFDTSSVTNMDSMFYGCRRLTTLDLTNFDTSNVTNMRYMFINCSSLTTLDLGDKFDTSSVTNMYDMFGGCSRITILDLGDKFDTSNVTNMYGMFWGCSSLTTLDLGDKFDTSNVTNMYGMFYHCSSLTTLDLGDKFDTSNVTTMEVMFIQCNNLTTIYAPTSFVTTNVTDSANMFTVDTNLVGGAGTVYDSSHIDKEYARVDDPDNGNPGYFTYKEYSGSVGGNISKLSNMIKNNGNKIVLLGSSIMVIILSVVLLLVRKKKVNK